MQHLGQTKAFGSFSFLYWSIYTQKQKQDQEQKKNKVAGLGIWNTKTVQVL